MICKKAAKNIIFSLAVTMMALAHCAITASGEEELTQAIEETPQAIQKAQEQEEAAESEISVIPGGIQGRVSLDLRNIDIGDALKFLALKAGMNIVITKNVTGRVTLTVDKVVVQDILDIMLRSNDLAYVKERDIYNIMSKDEYKMLFGKNFSDVRQVKVFRLKYAIPDQAFALLEVLKSDIGRILVEPDSGTVLIMDTPDSLKEIAKAMETLEEKNTVRVFTLQYAKAKDVEEQLKTQLDAKKVGMIKANERLNQIIVQTLPDRMVDVERLVQLLDKKTKEVLISTSIIKVKLTDQLDTGIEWEGLIKMGAQYGMTYFGSVPFGAVQAAANAWRDRVDVLNDLGGKVGSYPYTGYTDNPASGRKVTPGESMHIGIIDRQRDVDMVIKYLQTLGNTQVISNPKLAVINNHEARIHVGERQAYVTTTTTTGTQTTTVSEEVTFVDIGIQLAVTPTINDEGYITMKIKPEISSVVSYLITPTKNEIPIIDTSTAETTVMVKDGSSIIIGGLRREDKTGSDEGIPYLSKIPIIGVLFKNSTAKTEKTELMIIITPRIVEGDVLVAGTDDKRDFGYDVSKDYKDYSTFTKETDFSSDYEKPEQRIKPYKDKSILDLKEEKTGKKKNE